MSIETYSQPNELTSKLLGLRFTNKTTEQRFLAWRFNVNLRYIQLGIIINLISWLIGTPLVYFWDPVQFQQMLPVIAFAVVPSLLLGLALSTRPNCKRWTLTIATVLFLLNGVSVIYLFFVIGKSPSSMVIWCVFGVQFFQFMRLPPLTALLAVFPFTVWIVWSIIADGSQFQLSRLDSFTYIVAPILTLIIVVIVCALLDRVTRQTFALEQIIGLQDQALKRNGILIRRYIPRSVAEHIDAGDGMAVDTPQRKQVTVLFSDIVGFTALADEVDASSLTQILSTYMSTMVKLVETHGGTLNEFAGDGLMSIFGAPVEMPQKDQAVQAVKTAQAMHMALSQLNESWCQLGHEKLPLRIRIGINTGELSVGSFGSEGRMTYTAIGLQTNVAARIQAQCKPGGVLLSDSTWHLVKDDIPCEPMGKLVIEGVQFLVPVYEPSHA